MSATTARKITFVCFAILLPALVSCQSKQPAGTAMLPQAEAAAPQPSAEAGAQPPVEAGTQPPSEAGRQPVAGKNRNESHGYEIQAGTLLRVRLDRQLDTSRNRSGDSFTATLLDPVVKSGNRAIPKGTQFKGHVTLARPSGRLKGRGYLAVTLDSFDLNGQTYRIETSSSTHWSGSHKKRNLALIGGGSGFGAAVGAIASGGVGAAIGAAAGAGAGTAGAAITGRKQVVLPAETIVRFTLKAPVQIRG